MLHQFKLPELGENIEDGDVVRVLVSKGDKVKKDQSVIELETDKAVVEVPCDVEGVVEEIHVKEGDKARVGQVILTLKVAKGVEEAPLREKVVKKQKVSVPTKPKVPTKGGAIAASPEVRRLAREMGVDLNQVVGSGPGGRISPMDVKAQTRGQKVISTTSLPDFSKWGPIDRQPMSNVRRKTAERMAQAWSAIPHVTQFDHGDITDLLIRRKQFAKKVEEAGGKLTVTAIILNVVASALKNFPKFNASVDIEKEEIIYKNYYHIGVAVDTERGLIVPVIRDADKKNIIEISVELTQAAQRARNRKTTLEEMQGASFTVTNLGSLGTTYFAPVIHWPQVAILGIGRAEEQPIYQEGNWVPRKILPLSISYDHRIIDGADAARFLRWMAEELEKVSPS